MIQVLVDPNRLLLQKDNLVRSHAALCGSSFSGNFTPNLYILCLCSISVAHAGAICLRSSQSKHFHSMHCGPSLVCHSSGSPALLRQNAAGLFLPDHAASLQFLFIHGAINLQFSYDLVILGLELLWAPVRDRSATHAVGEGLLLFVEAKS